MVGVERDHAPNRTGMSGLRIRGIEERVDEQRFPPRTYGGWGGNEI